MSGHVPGARPGDGAMRASGDRLQCKTRRPAGINPKKLLVATSKEQTDASDRLASYPSNFERVSQCLDGKFDGTLCGNREHE